jgi:hypothetical protein
VDCEGAINKDRALRASCIRDKFMSVWKGRAGLLSVEDSLNVFMFRYLMLGIFRWLKQVAHRKESQQGMSSARARRKHTFG